MKNKMLSGQLHDLEDCGMINSPQAGEPHQRPCGNHQICGAVQGK